MFNKFFVVAAVHFTGTALIFKLLYLILPISITCYVSSIASYLLLTAVAWFSFIVTKEVFLQDKIQLHNKAVLITGCDSGFGHNLAKRLDSKGFHVFATCLFPSGKGAEKLKNTCSERLKILELDVTKDESVEKAVQFVVENLGSCELWAVVNNAGIGKAFCVDLCPLKDFQDCMDVNVFGVIRVTKAFLPLLKTTKGRLVNITSIAGRITGPHIAPYVVSKFAAVGLTYTLMQEMDDWGVTVISIEPEVFRTNLTDLNIIVPVTSLDDIENSAKKYYGKEYIDDYRKAADTFLNLASPNLSAVVDDLESAVTLQYPDAVYSPRRHPLFRPILYIFLSLPMSVQNFVIRVFLFLIRYKKPRSAH